MTGIVLFVTLLVFLVLNVPVGIAIGLASLAAITTNPRMTDSFIVSQLISGSDSFPLMAIPLFILAGELMAAGGVSKRILNVCNVFLGRVTGGLAIVTVVVCMFFAAVSGSGPATVAAVGSMVVPTMLERGTARASPWPAWPAPAASASLFRPASPWSSMVPPPVPPCPPCSWPASCPAS